MIRIRCLGVIEFQNIEASEAIDDINQAASEEVEMGKPPHVLGKGFSAVA